MGAMLLASAQTEVFPRVLTVSVAIFVYTVSSCYGHEIKRFCLVTVT